MKAFSIVVLLMGLGIGMAAPPSPPQGESDNVASNPSKRLHTWLCSAVSPNCVIEGMWLALPKYTASWMQR